MAPSEVSLRLSSRACFALSLFKWKLRFGVRVCLFKIAHYSRQGRGGFGLPLTNLGGPGLPCREELDDFLRRGGQGEAQDRAKSG